MVIIPRMVMPDDQWNHINDLLLGKLTNCEVTAKDNPVRY